MNQAAFEELKEVIKDQTKTIVILRLEVLALQQQLEALEPRADLYLYPEFGGEV